MKEDLTQMGIPHLFRCPISLDLFTDPVTLCTGQTYDRSSIERWLGDGNLTCPVTMQKLHDLSIVPNHTLHHLIDQWLSKGTNRFNPDHLKIIDPDLSLATLKHNLSSHEPNFTTRLETLSRISALSEIEWKRSCLIQLGFFPAILQFLFGRSSSSKLSEEDLKLDEKALDCALKLLPFCELGPLNMLQEPQNLESFVALFNQGSTKIKTSLCCLIEEIASSTEQLKELCLMFAQSKRLLQDLMISLVSQKPEASEAGIRAISAICCLDLNRKSIVREGGVDGLIAFLSSTNNSNSSSSTTTTTTSSREAWRAMATLELLLDQESARQALVNNRNGVKVLVKMVFKVCDHEGSESAVSSLLKVCCASGRAREEAISEGVVKQVLLLLQSQCSGRAKNKARALLNVLRSMWAEDPTKRNF